MSSASLLDRYLAPLLEGHRVGCRRVVEEALRCNPDPFQLYSELLWPVTERVERLYHTHRINAATEHMATRINRVIADQLQPRLPRKDPNGRRIVVVSAPGEPEELGAQICTDLFEADGWEVYFVGGGVPNDELLALAGRLRPDILLIFGTQPQGVPAIRHLIDMIRSIDAIPTLNIMISGGVFNRATGLWREIRADLFASTVHEALQVANAAPPRTPEIRVPEVQRKRQRRRRQPLEAAAAE